MSVKLNNRQVGDVTVIDVSGRITLGEGSSALRDTLRDLTAGGNKKILLNLSDVSYIDSSGIGELVSGFTSVANQAEPTNFFTGNVKEYAAIVSIDSDPHGLRPGMTAAVEILVANLKNVLSVSE